MKKRILYLCILCLFCTMLFAGCKNKKDDTSNNPNYDTEQYLSGKQYVRIDILNSGSIVLELDADAAPATVTNFIRLVKESFYNGLTFHRVIDGFMAQGGDPEGTGLGGSEYTIPGEFAVNGFDNPISHVRGTISMARAEDYDSASSQFFIVHQDATALDGNYAAFGKILYGMEVIDDICASTVVEDADGTVAPSNQPVISSIILLGAEAIELMEQEILAALPDPTATISFAGISSTEGLDLVDTWNIHEDGQTYILFSSENLVSLGIYETDLSTGIKYDKSAPLGFYADVPANGYISVKLTLPDGELPTLLIVAEEASGALGQYLICFDEEHYGGVYLVPVLN